tara:strand:- start:2336 stop:3457 length:1122 start_codon:yes stop_codon:yes gene_type:complete
MTKLASTIRKDFSFICSRCFGEFKPSMARLVCENCKGPLVVKYLNIFQNENMESPFDSCEGFVSLGEGNTPIVKMDRLAERLNISEIFGKLECLNPTGSFKDRGTAMMISLAKASKVSSLVEDSSGNAGSSVAAYCSKAGITAHIFVPKSAPQPKLDQISVYGAITHKIDGTREMVTEEASQFVDRNRLVYGAHKLSPYFLEGTKTFAYELVRQNQGTLPQHLIMPVGNGSLYVGAWLGFKEMIQKGMIERAPLMHAVQAENVRPIVNEFSGRNVAETALPTIAGGISVSNPPRSKQIIDILKETGGQAISVTEKAILKWQKIVAQDNGIYCEPTSAAAFAGLHQLTQNRFIVENESALVAITGFGLKDNLYI